MALIASDILDTVSEILLDETNIRWSAADLLKYLNEAQREVIAMDDQAGTVTVAVKLEQGKVRQTLPTGGQKIKDITFNLSIPA